MHDMIIIEKQKMEELLEQMSDRMQKMSERFEDALTKEEKAECLIRLKQMEWNYKAINKKYEELFNSPKTVAKVTKRINYIKTKYPNLKYDVDDPEVRKEIGKSLSYDSGYSGYTEKEAKELERLLSLTD